MKLFYLSSSGRQAGTADMARYGRHGTSDTARQILHGRQAGKISTTYVQACPVGHLSTHPIHCFSTDHNEQQRTTTTIIYVIDDR